MSDHDHGPPVPLPENLKDSNDTSDHTHDYAVPSHTHEHRGWRKWGPLAALAFVTLMSAFGLYRVEETSRKADDLQLQLIEQVAKDCVDRTGDIALRLQWDRVYYIIKAQRSGKVNRYVEELVPGVKVGQPMTNKIASAAFGNSYEVARKEAGQAPPCIGELPKDTGG